MEFVIISVIIALEFFAMLGCVIAAIGLWRKTNQQIQMRENRKELKPERIIEDFIRERG